MHLKPMKSVALFLATLFAIQVFANGDAKNTSWLYNNLSTFLSPKLRLRWAGVTPSEYSLMKAIQTNDVKLVKDIAASIDKKALGVATTEIEDPQIIIARSMKIDKSSIPSIRTLEDRTTELIGGKLEPIRVSVPGLAISRYTLATLSELPYNESKKILVEVNKLYSTVDFREIGFLTRWCEYLNSFAESEDFKNNLVVKEKAEDCFAINERMLSKEIIVPQNFADSPSGFLHIYLRNLYATADKYTVETLKKQTTFWIEFYARHNSDKPTPTVSEFERAGDLPQIHPFIFIAFAPIQIQNSRGYSDILNKQLEDVLTSSLKKAEKREWIYQSVLNYDFYKYHIHLAGQKAQKKDAKIWEKVQRLKNPIGNEAIKDCKAKISKRACWAASELIPTAKFTLDDLRLLCASGVGHSCTYLSINKGEGQKTHDDKTTSESEIKKNTEILRSQCRNNTASTCTAFALALQDRADSPSPKIGSCTKDSVELCFLVEGSKPGNPNEIAMKKACEHGSPDGCKYLGMLALEKGNAYFGNQMYKKACSLSKSLRPFDKFNCEDVMN